MLTTLRQQFSPSLLAQVLQHVQLQIKLLGSAASTGLWNRPRYSRGAWPRKLARVAKLRRAAQAHENSLDPEPAEDRGRRTEMHRVPPALASIRIVLSICQYQEFRRVWSGKCRP